jgi:hypothetical protein
MTETNDAAPTDLSGTVDERIARLTALETDGEHLPAEWLHRQLRAALEAWAEDETEVDIEEETRSDY